MCECARIGEPVESEAADARASATSGGEKGAAPAGAAPVGSLGTGPKDPSGPGGPRAGDRVFVGLSGGVDSALAAALLVEQGLDVTAVYMRNWSRDLPGFRCPWAEELADAERVAVTLGIDLEVWDCEEDYRRTVVDYLVGEYARGRTPNPDVMCNQTIKFGTFLDRALACGADWVATGHYARVRRAGAGAEKDVVLAAAADKGAVLAAGAELSAVPGPATPAPAAAPVELHRAADEHKDQTYFLWRVGQAALGRALFPVGDVASKAEVRRMVAARGLGLEDKPDSDGVCFVGPVGMRSFLLDALERRAGAIVEWETGRVLGTHDGAFLFTVGQRKGLDLGGGPARYVVATDVGRNLVWVTADRACPGLWCRELGLADVRWVAGRPPAPGRYLVRTRHTGTLRPATLTCGPGQGTDASPATVRVRFDEPVRTVAPGQSAVVYDGTRCLGGGIVEKSDAPAPPYARDVH